MVSSKRKLLLPVLLLTGLCLGASVPGAAARLPWRRKPKVEAAPSAPAKTPYQKFTAKRGLRCAEGFLRIYRDGAETYLEIPDSLMGRKVILSTVLRNSSSSWATPGCEVSGQKVFVLDKTDSLVLLREPRAYAVADDAAARRALERSATGAVAYAFPIQYRNADTTACVVNAGRLFSPSNKDAFSLRGTPLDRYAFFYNGQPKNDLTAFRELVTYRHSVGIVQNLTFGVAPYYWSGGGSAAAVTEETMRLSGDFVTTLTLLPERDMPVRVADPRVGVRSEAYPLYESGRGVKREYAAARWDLREGRKITVYVDTLFPVSWQQAIRKGLEAWNPAFEAIGLGKVVDVRRYPSYGDFSAEDPCVSKVRANLGSTAESVSASILGDGTTGGILSCTLHVPGGLIDGARKRALFEIADVDPRWQGYAIPDDALCEVVRAEVMQLFGLALGLDRNMAGSYAYSPAQLRSPAFTKVHGLTASVTDDVLFNLLARPGDRERGVVTTSDKIGAYDKFAIEWLYRTFPAGTDERAALDRIVAQHDGPQYRFLPLQTRASQADPRSLSGDLGNDPFELYDTQMNRLRYVADHLFGWVEGAGLENDGFRELVTEWLFLQAWAVPRGLSNLIGGIYLGDPSRGEPKYAAVPRETQERAVRTIYAAFYDMDWLDRNKDLLQYSGANRGITLMSRFNVLGQGGILSRFNWVALADEWAGSGYPLDDFLNDLTDLVTDNLRHGRLLEGEEFLIGVYISMGLIGNDPVLRGRYDEHFHKSAPIPLDAGTGRKAAAFPAEEDFPVTALRARIPAVPQAVSDATASVRAAQLERLAGILRSVREPALARRLGYPLSVADAALGNN